MVCLYDSYSFLFQGEGTTTSTAPASGETTSTVTTATTTHGRKSYNRSNTTGEYIEVECTLTCLLYSYVFPDATHHPEHNDAPTSSKKDEKEEILIPEKASSFKFHPGRLCQDQCYYCSGKFGLYDTPCHVGQIKSVERQQKILASKRLGASFQCIFQNFFSFVEQMKRSLQWTIACVMHVSAT